jgi:hypothetical protein
MSVFTDMNFACGYSQAEGSLITVKMNAAYDSDQRTLEARINQQAGAT